MALNPTIYGIILLIQMLLLLIDLSINALITLIKFRNTVMLAVYLTQMILLVVAFIILLCTFFNTYVCKAGLSNLLYHRFRCVVIICIVYIVLTIVLNIWVILQKWKKTYKNPDYGGFQLILFVIQRFWSAIYYYAYKRAALRIADPRFYINIDTLQRNKY